MFVVFVNVASKTIIFDIFILDIGYVIGVTLIDGQYIPPCLFAVLEIGGTWEDRIPLFFKNILEYS